MLGEVEVCQLPQQVTMALFDACTPEMLQQVLRRAFHELLGQVNVAGPPYARYFGLVPRLEVEVGVPVTAQGIAPGRARPSSLPSCEATVVRYSGPYEGLGEAYQLLEAWMASHDKQPAAAPWECYLADPPGLDADSWEIEVYWPIEDAVARPAAEDVA